MKSFFGEYRASNLNSFRLYGTSNENIYEYLDFFQLDNRSLCTIGSSFDYSINASFKNPRSIIIADINDFGFNIGSNVVWLSNVFDYLKNDEIIFKRIVKDLSNGGEVLYRYYWGEDFVVKDKLRMY